MTYFSARYLACSTWLFYQSNIYSQLCAIHYQFRCCRVQRKQNESLSINTVWAEPAVSWLGWLHLLKSFVPKATSTSPHNFCILLDKWLWEIPLLGVKFTLFTILVCLAWLQIQVEKEELLYNDSFSFICGPCVGSAVIRDLGYRSLVFTWYLLYLWFVLLL